MKRSLMLLWSLMMLGAFPVPAAELVFSLGEVAVTYPELLREIAKQQAKKPSPTPMTEEQLRSLAVGVIKRKLMAREAEGRGLDKVPVIADEIATARETVLASILIHDDRSRIKVPDMEQAARDYYDTHPDQYTSEEMIVASHILFKLSCNCVNCDCVAERAAKRAKAEEVKARLKQGEKFSQLAREYSEDEKTAKAGGSLGVSMKRSELVPAFANVAFALQLGEVSDIVTTGYGYHLIRLDEKIPGKKNTYEEVRSRLLAKYRNEYLASQVAEVEHGYQQQAESGQWNEEVLKRLRAEVQGEAKATPLQR